MLTVQTFEQFCEEPPTLEVSCPPTNLPPFVILITSFFFMEANENTPEEKAERRNTP